MMMNPASAQSTDGSHEKLPAVIAAGMEAYKTKGPEDAVKAWIKGSPIEGSKDALNQANNLRSIQEYYGNYEGFDIFSIHDLTTRVRLIYVVLNYEKGPIFGKFSAYRSGQAWIVTAFNFNTKEDGIFPSQP